VRNGTLSPGLAEQDIRRGGTSWCHCSSRCSPPRPAGVQGVLALEAGLRERLQGGGEAVTCTPLPQPLRGALSLTQPGRHERSRCSAAPTPAFGSPGCGAEHKPSPPAENMVLSPPALAAAPAPGLFSGAVWQSSGQHSPPENQLDQLSHREADPHTSCLCTGMGWWETGAAEGASVRNTQPLRLPLLAPALVSSRGHDLGSPHDGSPPALSSPSTGRGGSAAPLSQGCCMAETLPHAPGFQSQPWHLLET